MHSVVIYYIDVDTDADPDQLFAFLRAEGLELKTIADRHGIRPSKALYEQGSEPGMPSGYLFECDTLEAADAFVKDVNSVQWTQVAKRIVTEDL